MTLILENTNQVESHTNLYEIIEPFEKEFSELNWLLTNQDYQIFDYEDKGEIEKLDFESDKITFSGTELLKIIKNRKIDFIWCVFCGFKNDIPNLKKSELPYADLNSDIWNKPNEFLNKQSEIEIISFDGTATIFKTKNKEIENKFRKKFTDAIELKKTLHNNV
ncbi:MULTISPECIES: hypothetical protein [Flavobacteriaceae]|uniref:Uncharacterized protein n=1 Tax=Mangrovimonas cancribranchiae TaxID=3080055 RepID=A0AAU6NWV4_9FLAO|nr:hypothetical protein [Mesoflavibacter sp. SCSIO 43206]UAB75599.1 hypothetical protein INR78_01020 [Mesoflavibacter sp. SCSIO 43206]